MSTRICSLLFVALSLAACNSTLSSNGVHAATDSGTTPSDMGGSGSPSDMGSSDIDMGVPRDSGMLPRDLGTPRDAGAPFDAGPPGTRTVSNAEVAFDGTEFDLARQYGLYIQDTGSDIEVVTDPTGTYDDVIYFRKRKAQGDWAHVQVRLMDKREDYADVLQIGEYDTEAYHYKQMFMLGDDPQYENHLVNIMEDFHCEPCEANNLQLYSSYTDNTLCIWVTYSTDPSFDPRGSLRGGPTDPWELLGENRHTINIGADGIATLPTPVDETASLLLCRDDLHVSDILGRWVELEMLIMPSSYDTGVLKVWIDGRPYFYDGPNAYRYNQDRGENAVNVFQIGLYAGATSVASGTPSDWELWTLPPFVEVGDGILYTP